MKDKVHVSGTTTFGIDTRSTSRLGIVDEIKKQAVKIAQEVTEKNCASGRSPRSVAAAILKLVSVESCMELPVSEISRASHVSPATIGEVYRELRGELRL